MSDKEMAVQLVQSPETQDALQRIAEHNRPNDEQVWLQMWSSVANAWNCRESEAAARWADQGLRQFRARFPKA